MSDERRAMLLHRDHGELVEHCLVMETLNGDLIDQRDALEKKVAELQQELEERMPDDWLPVVDHIVRHPITDQRLTRIFIHGKGWYIWNSAFDKYNSEENYDVLRIGDLAFIRFDRSERGSGIVDTLELINGNWWHCQRGHYSQDSVLAGQPFRQLVLSYESLEIAKEKLPYITEIMGYDAPPPKAVVPENPPSWFNKLDAGEHWSEDDY